jgi:phytoene synthase
MCVRIFGFRDPVALDYADDLGLAMQLTNILRDVREDATLGRIYLPMEDLAGFGIESSELVAGLPGEGWEALIQFEVQRAWHLYESGLRVTELIPRSSAVCVRTMAGIYQSILEQIERDPRLPLRRRISLSRPAKLAVMVRSWLAA